MADTQISFKDVWVYRVVTLAKSDRLDELYLNRFGEAGWELVQVILGSDDPALMGYAIFKMQESVPAYEVISTGP